MSVKVKLFGIVNITEDSFSDGGSYLAPDSAIAHGRMLAENGADVIDLGAASSNPSANPVSPEVEIARLAPVVTAMKGEGIAISVDSFSPAVQRWALLQGADYINDVAGFPHTELYPELARSDAKLIVMHSVQEGPAVQRAWVEPDENIFDVILRFFEERLRALLVSGIDKTRLILDPGMGFFLGSNFEASVAVLRRLNELKTAFGIPVMVSVSRKSFLRKIVGRTPAEAGPATLAAELFAARQGVDFIRTHDPRALKDALVVANLLDGQGGRE